MGLGGLVLGGYALTRARAVGSETQALVNRSAVVSSSDIDPFAVRDVAVLHYDALEEMSGARSFSLALLNSEGDGVVITSINGRTESRTYAKAIVCGEADTLLSPEEYRVVRSARLGNGIGSGAPAPITPAPAPESTDSESTGATEPAVPAASVAPDDLVPAATAGGEADGGTGDEVGDETNAGVLRNGGEDKRSLITVLHGVDEGRHAAADGNSAPVAGSLTADKPEAVAKHVKASGKRTNGKDVRAPEPRSES